MSHTISRIFALAVALQGVTFYAMNRDTLKPMKVAVIVGKRPPLLTNKDLLPSEFRSEEFRRKLRQSKAPQQTPPPSPVPPDSTSQDLYDYLRLRSTPYQPKPLLNMNHNPHGIIGENRYKVRREALSLYRKYYPTAYAIK